MVDVKFSKLARNLWRNSDGSVRENTAQGSNQSNFRIICLRHRILSRHIITNDLTLSRYRLGTTGLLQHGGIQHVPPNTIMGQWHDQMFRYWICDKNSAQT